MANRLRDRVRVQVDGQLRTGRDLAIAALLGAEEFGFGTPMLVTLGCVMMRKCHMNTCAGRRRHAGPRAARPVRRQAGIRRTLPPLHRTGASRAHGATGLPDGGRDDRPRGPAGCGAAGRTERRSRSISARILLPQPDREEEPGTLRGRTEFVAGGKRRSTRELLRQAAPALDARQPVRIEMPIRNVDRAVGATLSGEIVRRFGPSGLPEDTIGFRSRVRPARASARFWRRASRIRVEGDANDYLGKGMSGGRIVLVPPAEASFAAHENVIAGNVALYGATAGEVYINGLAGERFAVRNSGAHGGGRRSRRPRLRVHDRRHGGRARTDRVQLRGGDERRHRVRL